MFWISNQLANHGLDHSCGLSVILPYVVQHTPMFIPILPLSAPPTILPARATQKLGANPTSRREVIVPAHPTNTTGLRPIRSDSAPQNIPLHASAYGKFSDIDNTVDKILPAKRQRSASQQKKAHWILKTLQSSTQASTHMAVYSSRQLALRLARGLR